MYYFRHIIRFAIFSILICTILGDPIDVVKIAQSRVSARQFPQLSFALPAIGFLGGAQSRPQLFGKSTVTRTILSTVASITAASFRTCTTSAAAGLMPCAGKRRRRGVGSGENEIEASPSIKLILGTTVITDPASVAQFFAENPPPVKSEVDMDNGKETTTMSPLERNLDATTILYPSVEEDASNDDILVGDLKDENSVTTETPYSSDNVEITTLDSVQDDDNDEEGKARAGIGGVVTVTSRIPITHVVQTAATGTTLATLTVSYMGCLPPSLPVVGLLCT